MTISDQIRDEKLKHYINRDASKIYHHYSQRNLISMNILKVKKYYHLIKNK